MSFDIVTPIFGRNNFLTGGKSRTRKKSYKYACKMGRRTLSRHYTKRAAVKACPKGARVVRIYSRKRRM